MERVLATIAVGFHTDNVRARQMSSAVVHWLEEHGRRAVVVETRKEETCCQAPWEEVDLLLTLGGDGTMLGFARRVVDREVPMLGLNVGEVGFLTELTLADWQDRLPAILAGEYAFSLRMVLSCSVLRCGQLAHRGYAVNDVVIGCGGLARMIRLDVWYGEDHLGGVRADGLIVATPTGSSGYSISAGGPLVYPELDVFVLTPICPFLHAFRPMVLPLEEQIRVHVQEARTPTVLTQDGQVGVDLQPGDNILVSKASHRLRLVRPLQSHYASKLKSKGFLRGN